MWQPLYLRWLSIGALAAVGILWGRCWPSVTAAEREPNSAAASRSHLPQTDSALDLQRALAFVDRPPERDVLDKITSGLKCRGPLSRNMLSSIYGGNRKSRRAVTDGLAWIVAHQQADGAWSFDHAQVPGCGGKCPDPGSLAQAANAATAMALLPLLGAGHTHEDGPYRDPIRKGLDFLVSRIKTTSYGGSLSEPGGLMYAHGLASLALCEAYAMTRDKKLREPAQKAIDFIVSAQDPVGGGWRYQPRQSGDTSVFGWQTAALHAAGLGGLEVPGTTLKKAAMFLDGVQTNGGTYGYTKPASGQATTAIGLLGRMHQGWAKDNAVLRRGVKQLILWGPSQTNLYYDYYAAQVMRNCGGEAWNRWNVKVRDALVDAQAKEGHAAGSWYTEKSAIGAQRGGRLYCTSMALLMLEVYYRYPPLYSAARPARSHPGVLQVNPN